MRCKGCGYSLWNLAPGNCPECGTAFKPSDFRFKPDSVAFKCPSCAQDYFGTDDMGLLEPRNFDCAVCRAAVTMDSMAIVPAVGVNPNRCELVLPWVDKNLGRAWKRLFMTCWRGSIDPVGMGRMLRTDPAAQRASTALRFMMWMVLIPGVVHALLLAVAVASVTGWTLGAAGGVGVTVGAASAVILVGALLLIPAVCLWALVTHAVLRVSGTTDSGYTRTLGAICYSSGPSILIAAPCIGPYCFSSITGIWWIIAAVIQVRDAQRVSTVRAVAGVGIPPVFIAAAMVAVYISLIVGLTSFQQAFAGPTGSAIVPGPSIIPTTSVVPGISMLPGTGVTTTLTLDPLVQPAPALESPDEEKAADDELDTERVPDPAEPTTQLDPK